MPMTSNDWQRLADKSADDLRHRKITPGTLDDLATQTLAPTDLTTIEATYERLYPADFAVAFIAGAAGAISSFALTDSFNKVHGHSDPQNKGNLEWYGKSDEMEKHPILGRLALLLRHPSSPMDQMPGRDRFGTKNHRLGFGHDLFNPMEAWPQMVKKFGTNGKAAVEWIRHLVADTFSKEGLPLPGHSHFRKFLLGHLGNDWSKYVTIKARDVTGAGLVSAILSGYEAFDSKILKHTSGPDYRSYTRSILAHSTCLVTGVSLGSLNYASLVLIVKNSFQMLYFDIKTSCELDQRLLELKSQIELPPEYGPDFRDMLAQIDDATEVTDQLGEPLVGKVQTKLRIIRK